MGITFEELVRKYKRSTITVLEEHEDHVDIAINGDGSGKVYDFSVSGNEVVAYED